MKRRRSPRIRRPTTPTCTRSSVPGRPDTVTLIANYIPLQEPDGGPNFFEFGDDVLYEIHIDNDGDGRADITYQFRFRRSQQPEHLPLQHRADHVAGQSELEPAPVLLGDQVSTGPATHTCWRPTSLPAVQHRARLHARTTRNWPRRRSHTFRGGGRCSPASAPKAFYVDLGAVFDLGRPAPVPEPEHLRIKMPLAAPGVNATKAVNVHTIAIQVPKSQLSARTVSTNPATRPMRAPRSACGRPRAASRPACTDGTSTAT